MLLLDVYLSCLAPLLAKSSKEPKDLHPNKAMKKLVLAAVLAASAIGARAGDLWQWAPNNWSYTDNHGRSWNGFRWAPGHTTWTDDYGHSRAELCLR